MKTKKELLEEWAIEFAGTDLGKAITEFNLKQIYDEDKEEYFIPDYYKEENKKD